MSTKPVTPVTFRFVRRAWQGSVLHLVEQTPDNCRDAAHSGFPRAGSDSFAKRKRPKMAKVDWAEIHPEDNLLTRRFE